MCMAQAIDAFRFKQSEVKRGTEGRRDGGREGGVSEVESGGS